MEADKLADKIYDIISSAHSRNLTKLNQATAKELWAEVKRSFQQPTYIGYSATLVLFLQTGVHPLLGLLLFLSILTLPYFII